MSSSRPIGVAIVGLGAIGREYAKIIKEIEMESGMAKLVAVVDQVPSVAEEIGKKYGAEYYTTMYEVLRNPNVDIVVIATPSYLHSAQAILAFEYGKDVIVDKPMSTSLLGAREMIKRAQKLGRKLGVIYQERYVPDVRILKMKIDEGALGRIFLVEGELKWYRDEREYYLRDEVARSWRGMWFTEGGGVLTTQGIHTVDLMLWLAGDVEEVSGFIANLTHPSVEVEDTAVAVMRFRNKALGALSQTISTAPKTHQYTRIRIYGTEGQAELVNGKLVLFATNKGTLTTDELEKLRNNIIQMQGGERRKALFIDFLRAYREGRDFPISGWDGYRSLELVKAIYISSTSSTVVKLPLSFEVLI